MFIGAIKRVAPVGIAGKSGVLMADNEVFSSQVLIIEYVIVSVQLYEIVL
jgi:hypothetical protein